MFYKNLVFQHITAAVPLPLSLPLSGAQRLLMPILVRCLCRNPSLINWLLVADDGLCDCQSAGVLNTHGLMESRLRDHCHTSVVVVRLVELYFGYFILKLKH